MNKYRNTKITTPDGKFDSKKEANRFAELKILERAKRIENVQRQVKFLLIPQQKDGKKVVEQATYYIADFTYSENGQMVVEDTKSPATRKEKAYIMKRKLMLYTHGIRIREV